jgi:hypothetical protein
MEWKVMECVLKYEGSEGASEREIDLHLFLIDFGG